MSQSIVSLKACYIKRITMVMDNARSRKHMLSKLDRLISKTFYAA